MRIGILFLGRKRPGFDQQWAAEMRAAIRRLPDEPFGLADWHLTIPSDNIADAAELRAAVAACRRADVAALLIVQPTIADGQLLSSLTPLWDDPLLLWATPERPDVEQISANSLVGTHVLASTLRQMGRPFEFVYGDPRHKATAAALSRAVALCHTATRLRHARIGLVGATAPGFNDLHSDPLWLTRHLGAGYYHESIPQLIDRLQAIDAERVAEDMQQLAPLKLARRDVATEDLPIQSRYYLALRDILQQEQLDALAIRCWPDLPTQTGHWPYLALARLVSDQHAVAMEGDVDGALCGTIAHALDFGPLYLSDWLEHDRRDIAIWHTGAAPFQLCEQTGKGRPTIARQFNNQLPSVVEATIRADMPATLFRLWRCDDRWHLTAIEGHTITPKRHLPATNGLLRVEKEDVHHWFGSMLQCGMPHHVCIVAGHHREQLRRLARLCAFDWETAPER